MKFYRYWSRDSAQVESEQGVWTIACYGGSNRGLDEAARRALENVRRAVEAIRQGRPLSHYAYADRPLREEVKEEFRDGGETIAVVTRNSYGSLVLNTARTMFIDIDYPAESGAVRLKKSLGRLFGRAVRDRDEDIVSRVEGTIAAVRFLGARLYRTANGYRCLVTSGTHDPTSAETHRLLEACGSDPLYIRLCRSQECFRARLTPKHWRCGTPRPPSRFPWTDPGREAEYRRWEQSYEERIREFGTCTFVKHVGDTRVDRAVERIVEIHDRLSCTGVERLA